MAMPGGRVGRAVLELATDSTNYTAGLARAKDDLKKFKDTANKTTFTDLVKGMSNAGMGAKLAGREAAATSAIIRGMSAAASQAGKVQVEAAKASQTFGQQLKAMGASAGLSMRALGGFGSALGVGAIIGFGRSLAASASHMEDLSAETGIGVERLQQFEYVAAGVGLSIDDVTNSVNQLAKRIASGDESALAALEALGIEAKRFGQAGADEQLFMLADGFGRVENQAQKTLLSFELLGRNGPRSLRLLNQELRVLVDQAPKIDKGLIKTLGRFDDMVEQGWIAFRVAAVKSIDFVAQHFGQALEFMTGGLSELVALMGRAGFAISAFDGKNLNPQELARLAAQAGEKPFGLPRPAEARLPGEAEQKELDRRVDDATDRTKKAADERERIHREEQAELVRRDQERQREEESARQKTIEAQRDFAKTAKDIDDEQAARNTEDAAERDRALDKDRDATRQFRNDEIAAYKAISDARNEIGESFMDADLRRQKEQQARLDEMRARWEGFADDITYSFTGGLADMLVHLRGFKDGFIGIWQDLRRSVANILSQMLADFIGGYVRKALAAAGVASLGGSAASAAGAGGAAAAGASGGGGAGAAIAGFATNPITIGVAAGIGLAVALKKGFLRGGQEGTQVNPRRDRFFGQFGPGGTGSGSGFAVASSLLRSSQIMQGLLSADTVSEWESAQSAAIKRLAIFGTKAKSFQMGGHIPPGVVQPAILHGGAFGEDIIPRSRPSDMHASARTVIINAPLHIQGVMDATTVAEVHRKHLVKLQNEALVYNNGGTATVTRRVVRGR